MIHSSDPRYKPWELQTAFFYHDDGLFDIALGAGALIFALLLFLNVAWLIGLAMLALGLGFSVAKWAVTLPRAKALTVSERQIERFWWTVYLVFGLAGLVASLAALDYLLTSIGILPPGVFSWMTRDPAVWFGLLGTLLLSIIAFINRLDRFHWYTVLSLGLTMLTGYLQLPIYGLSVVFGLVILFCGVWLLLRFSQRYAL